MTTTTSAVLLLISSSLAICVHSALASNEGRGHVRPPPLSEEAYDQGLNHL